MKNVKFRQKEMQKLNINITYPSLNYFKPLIKNQQISPKYGNNMQIIQFYFVLPPRIYKSHTIVPQRCISIESKFHKMKLVPMADIGNVEDLALLSSCKLD